MKRSRPSKACLCAILTVWIILALLCLITTSMVYLKPLLRVISFRGTSCQVQNVFYTTQYVCSCGEACTSYYPCFMVHVSINVTSTESWTVILYSDTKQQGIVNHSSQKRKENCSVMMCKEDPQENRDSVARFQKTYGQKGDLIHCYYAPWDISGGAVLELVHPGMIALHAVLWPTMSLVIGLGLCTIFCKKCRQIENLRDGDMKTIDSEAQRSDRAPIIVAPKEGRRTSSIGKKRKQRSLRSLWVMDT